MPFLKKDSTPQSQPAQNNLLEGTFFKLTLPKNFAQDPILAKKTKTQIALVIPKKSFFLYVNKDYKTRQPTEAEGNLEMLSRLKDLFSKKLEWEPGTETATLGGVPARSFRFEGEMEDQVFWTGNCLVSTYQGVLFLMIQATIPDFAESSDESWNQFLKTFQVRKDARPNWEPTPRKLKNVAFKDIETNIQVPEDVWQPLSTEGYPLKPKAVFLGKNPSDVGNFGNQKAHLFCFSAAKGTDEEKAWESPMMNLLQILNEEAGGNFKLETFAREPRKNNAKAAIKSQFFQLKDQDSPIKSVEMHQIATPKGSLILVIESAWNNRDYWSDEANEILKLTGTGE